MLKKEDDDVDSIKHEKIMNGENVMNSSYNNPDNYYENNGYQPRPA